jgi:hypothetical protein
MSRDEPQPWQALHRLGCVVTVPLLAEIPSPSAKLAVPAHCSSAGVRVAANFCCSERPLRVAVVQRGPFWLSSAGPQGLQFDAPKLTQEKKDHRSDRWPFDFRLAFHCQFDCGQTGGCRRVDARFALAGRTPAFGPSASGRRSRRTPVTLGIGLYRHSSRLARDGARDQSINRAIKRVGKGLVPSRWKGLRKLQWQPGQLTQVARV